MEPTNEWSQHFASRLLARLEELRSQRSAREPEFNLICDYIFPRRDFVITTQPQSLRRRLLMDITGMVAHERLSATLYGYMLSPHSRWTMPRLLNREPAWEEEVWFDHVSKRMHRWFSAASNTFRTAMAEDVLDITGLGSSVLWQDRSPNGPIYLSVAMRQCYWAENEQGLIDTCYRVYPMSLRRAAQRWPDSERLRKRITASQNPASDMVEILHVVEPRPEGRRGAVRDRKPFRDINVLIEGGEVLEVGGHERFKYNIGRFQRRPGDPYGISPSWKALPYCKLASAAMEAWVRNAEKIADPSLWTLMPRSTTIDRRPGAVNFVNAMLASSVRDPRYLLNQVEQGGDVRVTPELLGMIQSKIEQCYYVDWLTPNEGPQKTATEVYDLRDLRLRTMGPIVARLEHEKMNTLVEDTYEDLFAIDFFDPPPATLVGEEITFEYRGPLAISQRQGEAENILRAIEAGKNIAQLDEDVLMLFKGEDLARASSDAYGLDTHFLRSPKEYEERREAKRELGQMQEEMMAAQTAATALRDGGQGLASLKAAQSGQAA